MSTKTNLIVDTVIFATFLVMSNPHLTGNTIHEWLGVSFAAAIITHLLLHWDWIVNVGKTFFKKLRHPSRLNFVVNSLFFIAITGSLFTGLLISKDMMSTLGIQLAVGGNWKTIHTLMSDVSLIVLGIHVALHWKWIVTNVGRYVLSPIRVMFSRRRTPCASHVLTAQPVRVEKSQ